MYSVKIKLPAAALFLVLCSTLLQAQTPVQITITASAPGAAFLLEDGLTYFAPSTFTWIPGTAHTLTWLKGIAAQPATRYVFQGWSDTGASNPRTFLTPFVDTIYNANLKAQFQLSLSASPANAASLTTTPSSPDGFYDAGTSVQIYAVPTAGYSFLSFTGDLNGPASPQSLAMYGPRSVIANLSCNLKFTAPLSGTQGPGPAAGYIQWTAGSTCISSITSDSAWLTLGTSTGTGNTTIPFTISQNTGFPRTATITLAGSSSATLTIYQNGPTSGVPSVMSISPNAGASLSQIFTMQLYDASGYQAIDNVNVNFPLNGGCNIVYVRNGNSWTASLLYDNNSGYLPAVQVPGNGSAANRQCQLNASQFSASGSGNILTFTFGLNFFNSFIGDNQILVQAGVRNQNLFSTYNMIGSWTVGLPGCAYNIAGPIALFTVLGGQSSLNVTTGSICPWTATSDSNWLIITSGVGATGNGAVNYTVAPNPAGGQRIGTLTIAGQAFTITQGNPSAPSFSLTLSHTGNFYQGQQPANYTIVVSNATGSAPAAGTVTVTETLPPGLTLIQMAGTGWTCTANVCTRVDGLNGGSAYPPITVTANVNANAAAVVTNSATVAGGGAISMTATDATTVITAVLQNVPNVISLLPMASTGSSQTLTLQFASLAGAANLSVVNVLMNSALDGRRGCYIAYAQQNNTLYLVNDNGDAGGPYAGSFVMNGSGGAVNSQCTVIGSGSSVVMNGTTLTLTLNLSFSMGFNGNRVVYAAARDIASNNSGWQTVGVHAIPPIALTYPTPVGMSPASGTGTNPTLTFVYQDATQAVNLQTAWALINTSIDGRGACYVAYYRPANQIFLVPDNGDGSQAPGMSLDGGGGVLNNSQCTISSTGSYATINNNQLTVGLNIAFKQPAFTGSKAVFMAVQTLDRQVSPWQALGVWRVP